jgi:hypothetical protein
MRRAFVGLAANAFPFHENRNERPVLFRRVFLMRIHEAEDFV